MDYAAPVEEMLFAIRAIAGAEALEGLPGGEHLEPDTLRAVLDAAGAFAAGELALDPYGILNPGKVVP